MCKKKNQKLCLSQLIKLILTNLVASKTSIFDLISWNRYLYTSSFYFYITTILKSLFNTLNIIHLNVYYETLSEFINKPENTFIRSVKIKDNFYTMQNKINLHIRKNPKYEYNYISKEDR